MSGSLQSKIYGNHRHSSTVLKRMGSYHSGPVKEWDVITTQRNVSVHIMG